MVEIKIFQPFSFPLTRRQEKNKEARERESERQRKREEKRKEKRYSILKKIDKNISLVGVFEL